MDPLPNSARPDWPSHEEEVVEGSWNIAYILHEVATCSI